MRRILKRRDQKHGNGTKSTRSHNIGDACRFGTQWQDLSADFYKELLTLRVLKRIHQARNQHPRPHDDLERLHAQIAAKLEAHSQFEDRVRWGKMLFLMHHAATTDDVDKSVVVIWGLGDKTVQNAKTLLRDLMFHMLSRFAVTTNEPRFGLVQFASPAEAMRFFSSQEKTETCKPPNDRLQKIDHASSGAGWKSLTNFRYFD